MSIKVNQAIVIDDSKKIINVASLWIGGNGVSNLTARFDGVDALKIPTGTTGQQPSGEIGLVRYNTSNNAFEGYSSSGWGGFNNSSVIGSYHYQLIVASGTFIVPAGTTSNTVFHVLAIGGGGGGAGNNGSYNSQGGQAGSESEQWYSGWVAGNTLAITIGGSGNGGSSAPNPGSAGGTTTFSSGTQTITTMTAPGGRGGSITGSIGQAANTGTGAAIVRRGQQGRFLDISVDTRGGDGGNSSLGGQGDGQNDSSPGNGVSGTGGGGGTSIISSTGGSGANGVTLIEWVI